MGKDVLIFLPASAFRKLWLAIMIVFQTKPTVLCIFQVNFQALIMMAIVGYTQPMRDNIQNRMELLNETFVLVFTYHLYLFTDFMTNLELRSTIGKVLVYIVMFNIALNLGAAMLGTMSTAVWRLKIIFLRFKQKRQVYKR